MLFSRFKKSYSSTIKENNFLKIALVILVLANLWLISIVSHKKPVTILVPPTLSDKVEVKYNSATEEYKKSWGLFFATLLGNVTPKNIKFIADSIGSFLEPDIYQEVMEGLYKQAREIKSKELSISFHPKSVIYDKEKDIVFIKGSSVVKGTYGKPQTFPKTWEMQIKIKNYQPKLSYITSYLKKKKENNKRKKNKNKRKK
jgi:conjugal transfer pilus assembly protein TraE